MNKNYPPIMTEEERKLVDCEITKFWDKIHKLENLYLANPTRKLAKKIRAKEAGKKRIENKLVERNMLLALGVAGKMAHSDTILKDLFQHGCIGLMRAAKRYDPKHGAKYSTYARFWVRQEIRQFLVDSNIIHLPNDIRTTQRNLTQFQDEFYLENGHFPRDADIMAELGFSVSQIKELRAAGKTQMIMDLNRPVGEDKSDELSNFISNDNSSDVVLLAEEKDIQQKLWEELGNILNEQELRVITLHYVEGKKIADIAKSLKLSRERIRKVKEKALKKMRLSEKIQSFR